ncbi:histidine kinase dimerization/phospho-acceptor domain-containing protein, partial [uncultured Sphingomonas sp.]
MPTELSSGQSQLLRQQTILAQFGELALRSDSLDEILTEACRLVGEAFGTDLAKVVELQPDGRTLRVRAGIGWEEGVVGVATIEAKDDTSEGYALKTGEPMISPDIDQETRFEYAPFLIENGARAVANVIIIGGKDRPPFGILQVDSRTPREFDENDIAFLRSYANLLAATVDRLRVIDEAKDSTARLRLALEAGELGSFEMDLATGEITRSARYDQIFGYATPPSTWTRETALAQVLPEDREHMAAALRPETMIDRSGLQVEGRIHRADDEALRWIEIRARADDATTPPTRLVGVVADITDRKLAEQSLTTMNATLEAQVAERTVSLGESNAQLDAFAYTVSHDLRAPLRAMEGFARILLDDFGPGLGQEGERFAGRIVGAAKRMEVLIDDLLAFSRVQRSEVALQAVDPARAVDRALAELRSSVGDPASISLEVATPLPLVRADRVIFGQVIGNLIANAAKFQQQDEAMHIVIRAERRADRVRIWIEDDGIGIAPEHQQRIFNVFERLHG